MSALAYKVQIMDDGRRMVYLRIYSGTLRVGQQYIDSTRGDKIKPSRIFLLHANKRTRVEKALAGQIVGVLGFKKTYTGDTICDLKEPLILEAITAYEPVISQTVEPETLKDRDKLLEVLGKLGEEDPTFRYTEDGETGDTLISGMGELHLEVLADRIRREFKLDVRVGKPQVVYVETCNGSAEGEADFEREQEEDRLYGQVRIRVDSAPRGSGIQFVNKATEEYVRGALLEAIEAGVNEGVKSGPKEGYPMDDLKVTLLSAGWREGWREPLAYKIAASIATRNAAADATPVMLEPIMTVEITVPDENVGEIIGGINARGGRVEDIDDRGTRKTVEALVPLRAMFGYATELRSLTQGRGVYSMQFHAYDSL